MNPATITIQVASTSPRARTVLADGDVLTRTSRDVLRAIGLVEGDTAAPEVVLLQLRNAEPAIALERAFRILAYRERSSHELRSRLRDDGFSESTCAAVLGKLHDLDLVDDRRFTALYVRSKSRAGWGIVRIRQGLRTAGISDEIAGSALAAITDDDEYTRALDAAMRRSPRTNADQQRLTARLARRGFSLDIARRAARAASAAHTSRS